MAPQSLTDSAINVILKEPAQRRDLTDGLPAALILLAVLRQRHHVTVIQQRQRM